MQDDHRTSQVIMVWPGPWFPIGNAAVSPGKMRVSTSSEQAGYNCL